MARRYYVKDIHFSPDLTNIGPDLETAQDEITIHMQNSGQKRTNEIIFSGTLEDFKQAINELNDAISYWDERDYEEANKILEEAFQEQEKQKREFKELVDSLKVRARESAQ